MFTIQHEPKLKEQRGAIFVLTAVLGFMLLIVTALAVDFGTAYTQKELLQNAADAAALAGGNQLEKDITSPDIRTGITTGYVDSYIDKNIADAKVDSFYSYYDSTNNNTAPESSKIFPNDFNKINILAVYSPVSSNSHDGKTIYVELRRKVRTYFLRILGFNSLNIVVHAKAKYVPGEITTTNTSIFKNGIYGSEAITFHSPGITIDGNVRTNGKINLSGDSATNTTLTTGHTVTGLGTKDADGNTVGIDFWGTQNWQKNDNVFLGNYSIGYDTQYTSQGGYDINYKTNTYDSNMAGLKQYITNVQNGSSTSNYSDKWWDDKNEYAGNSRTYSQKDSWAPVLVTSSTGAQIYYTSGSVGLNMHNTSYTNDGVYKPMVYNQSIALEAARYYNVVIANGDINVNTTIANNADSPVLLISLNGNINFHNSAAFYGIVYAPNGNLRVDVGGTIYGSIIGKTIDIWNSNQTIKEQSFANVSGFSGFYDSSGSGVTTNASVTLVQ